MCSHTYTTLHPASFSNRPLVEQKFFPDDTGVHSSMRGLLTASILLGGLVGAFGGVSVNTLIMEVCMELYLVFPYVSAYSLLPITNPDCKPFSPLLPVSVRPLTSWVASEVCCVLPSSTPSSRWLWPSRHPSIPWWALACFRE